MSKPYRSFSVGMRFDLWASESIWGRDMSNSVARTKAEAEELAAEQDLVAFFPKPNELLLDIDQPFEIGCIKITAGLDRIESVLRTVALRITDRLWTKSKSGNAHLYLRMDASVSEIDRIVLQACMGSDLRRELYNYVRGFRERGEPYSSALFETQEEAINVRKWRRDWVVSQAKERIKEAKMAEMIYPRGRV